MSNTTQAPEEYGTISENTNLITNLSGLSESQQFVMVGDGSRIAISDLKSLMFEEFIGKISSYPNKITDTEFLSHHMECNGQILKQSDYPILYSRIGDLYKTDDVTEGSFALPDLRGYFLRGATNDVAVGTAQVDMMRKIVGTVSFINSSNNEIFNGAFTQRLKFEDHSANASGNFQGNQSSSFDSSLGIEGQEGKASPNVGSETRPMNYSVIYYIVVK